MNAINGSPVFSARQVDTFTPEGSTRTYQLAPLTFLEKRAMTADLVLYGGIQPTQDTLRGGLRSALREVAPANLDELLAILDAYEETPDDLALRQQLGVLEQIVAEVPSYQILYLADRRARDAQPYVAAMHALRGWSGDDLPPFARVNGRVPADLLDTIPLPELTTIGWRAMMLINVGMPALKNSEAPSPAPSTETTSPAA
jgi:hypothetical protein